MLRLTDVRTGRAEPLRPATAGLLRLHADADASLRDRLVEDVLGRTCEAMHRWRVRLVGDAPDLVELNVRPLHAPPGEGPVDVTVGTSPPDDGARWLQAAPLTGAVEPGDDPLGLRLAVLTAHHTERLELTPQLRTETTERLRRWRARVAEWAESPSRAMCADYVTRLRDALDDDLRTPAVLALLDELERDESIPAGSRFETFAYADRVLAVDLVRDVGRPR